MFFSYSSNTPIFFFILFSKKNFMNNNLKNIEKKTLLLKILK